MQPRRKSEKNSDVLVGLRPVAPELAEGDAGHRGGDDRAVLARGERGRAGAGPVAEERRRDRAGPLGVQLLADRLVEAVPGGVAQRQPGGALVAGPAAVDQAGGRGVEEVVDLLPVAGADVDAPQLLPALPEGEPPRVALTHRHQPLAGGRLGRGERDVRVRAGRSCRRCRAGRRHRRHGAGPGRAVSHPRRGGRRTGCWPGRSPGRGSSRRHRRRRRAGRRGRRPRRRRRGWRTARSRRSPAGARRWAPSSSRARPRGGEPGDPVHHRAARLHRRLEVGLLRAVVVLLARARPTWAPRAGCPAGRGCRCS